MCARGGRLFLDAHLVTFGVYLYQLAPRPHPGCSSASGPPAEPGYLVGGPTIRACEAFRTGARAAPVAKRNNHRAPVDNVAACVDRGRHGGSSQVRGDDDATGRR